MLSVVVPACELKRGSVDNKILLSLVLVSLLALALRVYQIDRESFWLDEAFSYWRLLSDSSEEIIFRQEARDEHPPFYSLILHYWMKIFGESDWAIRFLSDNIWCVGYSYCFLYWETAV